MNSSVGQLRKQGFEVVYCHKKTDNVSELRIRKNDSELIARECLFWIDIQTQRCFIKQFVYQNSLIGKKTTKENTSIEVCQETALVKLSP